MPAVNLTRPDASKSEVLIAVTNKVKLTMDEIRDVVNAKEVTNLSIRASSKW